MKNNIYGSRVTEKLYTIEHVGVNVNKLKTTFSYPFLHPGNINIHSERIQGTELVSFQELVEAVGEDDALALILQKSHGKLSVDHFKIVVSFIFAKYLLHV